ncbi:ANKYRIN REPEAT-CONTAINING PROTEIN ITN1-LIKE [Salix koriyanagi]|uniref:ANKYRIN REPEAT-CONTAINING PROTEIN ITN1-LIKE n=1 Tax=Salix koriyanagi TaxID=2511006 RepID=A0A9Q0UD94_9ROSI|nr:ANKYRIN REPEAT-CONTAINING PROTEIN ITN1-LIKE [Salix koriyanagi]
MDSRLYRVAKSGNVFVLRQLLNENPWLLTKLTPQGNTPLHIAVQFAHKGVVVEIYKRCGSLLTGLNSRGDSPLHVAARCGHLSIVDFLVREVLSAERISAEIGKTGKFDMLRQGNKVNNTVLHEAVRSGNRSVVQLLLRVDPNLACFENYAGESPLFLAAREGKKDILNQILISAPSSAHGGSEGQTALHAAVIERHSDITEILLREKPHLITEADHHGRTPLYYAAFLGDCKAVGRLLELDKVDHRARNENGQSVFDIDESIRETCFSYRCNIMTCIWRKLPSVSNRITGKKNPPCADQEAIARIQTYKRMGNTLLLVATLIATVTFAAAFTLPGGFNNDRGPKQGVALLESSKRLRWFIFSDAIAMTSSIIAACIIFWGAVINDESYVYYLVSATVLTYIALQSAVIAFLSGIGAALPDQPFVDSVSYIVGISFHVSVFLFLLQLVRIFNDSEIFQFLIFCFWKMKCKINK